MKFTSCFIVFLVLTGAFIGNSVFAAEEIAFTAADAVYLLTEKDLSIDQVKNARFRKLDDYPDILKRPQEKTIWVKGQIHTNERQELVFDFIRKDFVKLHIYVSDSLIASYQTGFLLPASEKKMGRWNAIDFIFEPNTDYTLFFQIDNVINDPDLVILVAKRGHWRETLLYELIQDIAFLSAILIHSHFFKRRKCNFRFCRGCEIMISWLPLLF